MDNFDTFDEELDEELEQETQAKLFKQKQLENPVLQRMKFLKEKQQEQLKLQLQNQS